MNLKEYRWEVHVSKKGHSAVARRMCQSRSEARQTLRKEKARKSTIWASIIDNSTPARKTTVVLLPQATSRG